MKDMAQKCQPKKGLREGELFGSADFEFPRGHMRPGTLEQIPVGIDPRHLEASGMEGLGEDAGAGANINHG